MCWACPSIKPCNGSHNTAEPPQQANPVVAAYAATGLAIPAQGRYTPPDKKMPHTSQKRDPSAAIWKQISTQARQNTSNRYSSNSAENTIRFRHVTCKLRECHAPGKKLKMRLGKFEPLIKIRERVLVVWNTCDEALVCAGRRRVYANSPDRCTVRQHD